MKQSRARFIGQAAAAIVLAASTLGRAGDTEPLSMAWHRSVKVVYEDLGSRSPVRLSAKNILEAMLPRLSGRKSNVVNIESGACTKAVTEIVKQLKTLDPADVDPSFDVRVVFIFTRVDGYSVLLSADSAGQFEWANIKHKLPTLEQRKALWRTLPYEVVKEYPGPIEEHAK